MAKFHGLTPSTSEVIGANTLNFEPIFDPLLKKIVRKTPVSSGGCTSKTWSFCGACKNLGAQHPLGTKI